MLAEAVVVLRSEGMKEIIDSMKSMSEGMKSTQQALNEVKEALTEPIKQMNLFGEDTKKSMETAKDAIEGVNRIIDDFTNSTSSSFEKISEAMSNAFKDGEQAAQEYMEKIKETISGGSGGSGGTISTGKIAVGTAVGSMIAEAIVALIHKVGETISGAIKSGREMDDALDYIRTKSKDDQTYKTKEKNFLDMYYTATAGQTPEKVAKTYGYLSNAYANASKEELDSLSGMYQQLNELYKVDTRGTAEQMYNIVKTRGLKTDTEKIAETKKLINFMVAASADSKLDFSQLLDQFSYILPMASSRGWSPESMISQMSTSGGAALIRFLAFFGGGKGQAMDLAKTLNAHLESQGSTSTGYYDDKGIKKLQDELDTYKDRNKGNKQAAPQIERMQEEIKYRQKYNKERLDSYTEVLQQLSTGPEGLYRISELFRREYQDHIKDVKKKNPQITDQAQIEAMAKKDLQANLGLVGIRAGRFIPALEDILRGSDADSRKRVTDLIGTIKGEYGGDAVGYMFGRTADDMFYKMDKWQKTTKDLYAALSALATVPLNAIFGPMLEVRAESVNALRKAIEDLLPGLEKGAQAFANSFFGFKMGEGANLITKLSETLKNMKDYNFEEMGEKLAKWLAKAGDNMDRILSAALKLADLIHRLMPDNEDPKENLNKSLDQLKERKQVLEKQMEDASPFDTPSAYHFYRSRRQRLKQIDDAVYEKETGREAISRASTSEMLNQQLSMTGEYAANAWEAITNWFKNEGKLEAKIPITINTTVEGKTHSSEHTAEYNSQGPGHTNVNNNNVPLGSSAR